MKHTEELALEHGILSLEDNYEKLASEECREFSKKYTIQVGSNRKPWTEYRNHECKQLAIKVIVHMSADAKQWKKRLAQKPRGKQ